MSIYDYIVEVERYGKKVFDINFKNQNRRILGYKHEGMSITIDKEKGEVRSIQNLKEADDQFNHLEKIGIKELWKVKR